MSAKETAEGFLTLILWGVLAWGVYAWFTADRAPEPLGPDRAVMNAGRERERSLANLTPAERFAMLSEGDQLQARKEAALIEIGDYVERCSQSEEKKPSVSFCRELRECMKTTPDVSTELRMLSVRGCVGFEDDDAPCVSRTGGLVEKSGKSIAWPLSDEECIPPELTSRRTGRSIGP